MSYFAWPPTPVSTLASSCVIFPQTSGWHLLMASYLDVPFIMFSAVQKKSGGSKFFCEGRQIILQGTRQRMKISIGSWILQNVVFIQLLLYIKLYVWFYLKDIYWFLICKLLLQWAFTPLWCWWLNIFCYFIFRKIQLFIVCLLTVHKQDFAQKNFNAKNKNKRKMKKIQK